MDNTGNLEPKKSAFRVRTKVGSQQGLRQSGVIGEGIPPPVRPTTKQEDKPKREHKMTQSLITATKAEMEENEAKVEEVPAETKEEDGVEKGDKCVGFRHEDALSRDSSLATVFRHRRSL